jgi:hypothetical protein
LLCKLQKQWMVCGWQNELRGVVAKNEGSG